MVNIVSMNITEKNIQLILKQRFEAIKYGCQEASAEGKKDIEFLYQYFVIEKKLLTKQDFSYSLACAEVASRR